MSAASQALAFCLHGVAYDDADIYVMINSAPSTLTFGIHEGAAGDWRRAVDTALDSPCDIFEPGKESVVSAPFYSVRGRSVVVLLRQQGSTESHRSP